MTEEMENIETANDDLEKFKAKYEVTWLNEIKITIYFTLGIAVLCGVLFLALFFTRSYVKDYGTIQRYVTIFEKALSPKSMKSHLKDLTSTPHYAGTVEGDEVGRYLAFKFKELLGDQGVTVYNETYKVLLSHPEGLSSLTYSDNATTETASLFESPIAGPKPTENVAPSYSYWNKSWLAYAAGGVANGKLVYVNYGRVEDFNKLKEVGVDLNGTIVIARYGKIFRGNIVRTAELKGCKGVILYSDPADDGADVGKVYPDGPFRPDTGLQRGSVMYLGDQPGDPTTPGYPSLPNQRRRIQRSEAKNLPKIPVLAISARDALSFMKHLDGEVVPDTWKGGLGVVYKYGTVSNPWEVKMDVKMKEELTEIHNVFARIEGKTEPDRFVMVGNHRDPWVYGAVDPHSGTSVLLELAASYGLLLKNGWRPRRSLILAFWDAEEQGLIGSTEFVEQYRENLRQQCLAYVNVDSYWGDELNVVGSAALAEIVRTATKEVQSPNGNGTLFDSWVASSGDQNPLPTLVGSGSDYTAFYHHVGIPILDLSFRQKKGMYGAYHSVHDNFDYFTNYIDKDFKTGLTLAKLVGKVVFGIVDEIVLNYSILVQGQAIEKEVKAIKNNEKFKQVLAELPEKEKLDVENAYSILERASDAYVDSGNKIESEYNLLRRLDAQSLNYLTKVRSYNDRVVYAERGFVSNDGLPGRTWYKHVISAPGRDLGYSFEVFPSFQEALRAPKNESGVLLLNALSDLADSLESSTSFVTGSFSLRNTNKV